MKVRRGLLALACFVLLLGLGGCGTSYTVRHTVEPGDTLYNIAKRYGTTVAELRDLNHLRASDVIHAGDILFVPGAPGGGYSKRSKASSGKKATAGTKRTTSSTTSASTPQKQAPLPPVTRGSLAWPVSGGVVKKYDAASRGVELRAGQNDPVRASASGKVTYAGTPAPAYGAMVIVAHGGNLFTVYSQLGRLEVKGGDRVATGQLVGRAGSRGAIHFEVRQGKTPRDPLLYLPRK